MRAVEKWGYHGVTIWAVPSKTARGRQRKQAGRHEDTCHGRDRDGPCADWIIRGGNWQRQDRQGKGGFCDEEQEMPSRGR